MRKTDVSELIGNIYGRLIIIGDSGVKNGMTYVLCSCSCGRNQHFEAPLKNLKNGNTKSCGCLNKEILVKIKTTHGYSRHPLYGIWGGLKSRCYNKTREEFKWYGGRGIIICDGWLHDFKPFYDWCMANGYKEGLEIDRIDNDGPYTPDNCRFVTHHINTLNRKAIRTTNKSGYCGVSYRKDSGKWTVSMCYNGEIIFKKSTYLSPLDAAVARDTFIIKNRLPLALNFPELAINGPL